MGSHCFECRGERRPGRASRVGASSSRRATVPLLLTKSLVGLNVAVALLSLGGGSSAASSRVTAIQRDFGLFGPAIAGGEWWRLVTSGFVHFGALHLLFNAWILYQLGVTLEEGIGRARFATIFGVSLLAGSLGALLLTPGALTAGASGAVFGLAGAATLGLARRGVPFWNTGWGPLLVINLVITFTLPQVSVGGHLGGLVGGVAAGWLLLDPRAPRRAVAFVLALAVALAATAGSVAAMANRYGSCRPVSGYWTCDR